MSLLVWIPMVHGNCKDQGLLGVETSVINTVTYVDGKLGKAAQIGNGNQVTNGVSINTNLVEELGTQYSCSVWVKPLGNHVHYEGAIISSGDWNHKRWAFGVNQDNSCVDIFCGGHNRNVTCSVPINQWTHLISVNDNGNVNLYKNGILVSTTDASSWPLDSDATNTTIGRETYAGGYFSFNGCIQDLRIYDHALSPLEVKHLAQGLVLHYPLNRGGFGGDNLLVNTDFSGVSKKYTLESGSEGGLWFPPTSWERDTEYTVSCRLRGNANMNLYLISSSGNQALSWVNRGDLSTTDYRFFSITFTSRSDRDVSNLYICTRYGTSNSSVGDWFEIAPNSLKLERCSTATHWTPAPSDDLYSQIGLDNNIEYDVSGYGNNGTRNGIFSWSGDTPRYGCSTIFNGINNAIQTPNLTTMITDKNYTISCWTYKTVIGTKNYQTIYGGPSGFELEARNVSGTDPLFRIHNWGGGTTPYVFGEWTHFCFVHTDSDSKLYVNGELKITGSSVNIPSGNYYIGAWSVATSQNYDGLMSDFRIYATALSADDVMALYKNAGYVDSDGNVYAYEMTE